jgi:hypothetical protein
MSSFLSANSVSRGKRNNSKKNHSQHHPHYGAPLPRNSHHQAIQQRTLYPGITGGNGKNPLSKKIGYKSRQKAIETIWNIRKRPFHVQRNIINTLYQRARYHPNQTTDMKKAMVLFKRWLTIAKQKNKGVGK